MTAKKVKKEKRQDIILSDKDAAVVWREKAERLEMHMPNFEGQEEVPENYIYLAAMMLIPTKFPELYKQIITTINEDMEEKLNKDSK